LSVGRPSNIDGAIISRQFPERQPLIVGLSKLARISEDASKAIYGRRYSSLRELYSNAERIYGQLREFAKEMDIGSAPRTITHPPALHQLHNREPLYIVTCCHWKSILIWLVYYHTIVLTFRPFLISEASLQLSRNQRPEEQMWLRQACRYAIDAAQDLIVYTSTKTEMVPQCRVRSPTLAY
jgi:hypothetical protein